MVQKRELCKKMAQASKVKQTARWQRLAKALKANLLKRKNARNTQATDVSTS